jgi:hypothetical protein
MSCSLGQEPYQSRCSRHRLTQMEGQCPSPPPRANGGAAPCYVVTQRRRGLIGFGIPPTHGSAQEERRRRRAQEKGPHLEGQYAQEEGRRPVVPSRAERGAHQTKQHQRQPLWYCDNAMRREKFYFCVTSLLCCKNGTPFTLPVGDGCHVHSVPPIVYLTLFHICNVLLK